MINKLQLIYSKNSYKKRSKIFYNEIKPAFNSKILDLGGGNGFHISQILGRFSEFDVTIADILTQNLKKAQNNYGFKTVQLDESSKLPFIDNEFDIVYSNSVIEHVTLPKERVWTSFDSKDFRTKSFLRQKEFADEIRRVGKSYFVQTPYKYFLIESHTWLPILIVFLPRRMQIRMIKFFNSFWPKKATPDWNLLTIKDMKVLFPDAQIYKEKSFGFTKSIIAIKKSSNETTNTKF